MDGRFNSKPDESGTGQDTILATLNGETERLAAVTLDENTIGRSSTEVEHERAIAIYDLVEDNIFHPIGDPDELTGPYQLHISLQDAKLALAITFENGAPLTTHILSLTPLRKIIRDYYMICDSYFAAIKTATPSQIETIDMARRGVHNEGSQLLMDRLSGKVVLDFDTARRLFTLVCVLHWKG